jgi:hypothetical protein
MRLFKGDKDSNNFTKKLGNIKNYYFKVLRKFLK